MKNTLTITVRTFPVVAHDHRTGKEEAVTVPVTKQQLQAAQLVGQSSKELIEQLCEKQGYTVIEIGQPDKHNITLNLEELVKQYEEHQEERAKWNYLYGGGAVE